MFFPCSRIFYLCLESLGLDITSVIFTPFKMAATYPLCDFFLSKESIISLILSRYTWSKEFCQFQQALFLDLKLARMGSFPFLDWKYTYEVVPTYWLVLTLDSCSRKRNHYFLLELHHGLLTLQTNKTKNEGSSVEQNKWCRAGSNFIPIYYRIEWM